MPNNRKGYQLRLFVLVLVSVLSLLAGCCPPPIDSNIGTDSIYASMQLYSPGDGSTSVEVRLSASEGGANIYLASGDELKVLVGGNTTLLQRRDFGNSVTYTGRLNTDAPGTDVTISLERGPDSSHPSAPDSYISLPDAITIQAPQSGATFTEADEIVVSWEPSGVSSTMPIDFKITCQNGTATHITSSYNPADDGSETYPVASLLGRSLGEGESCDVTITLTRKTTGTVSAVYQDGEIVATREETVSVKITP